MLQEQELQREKDIESLQLARENRKKERALRWRKRRRRRSPSVCHSLSMCRMTSLGVM